MEWRSPSGVACMGRAPATAGDIIELQLLALSPLRMEEARGQRASPSTVAALLRWCARHTQQATHEGSVATGLDALAALDAWLVTHDLAAYAAYLVGLSSMPADLLEQCGAYLDVIALGGCECRWCQPRTSSPPPTMRPKGCLVGPIPEPAREAVAAWWPLRQHADAAHPYWSHQLASLWSAAQGKRHAEARRKADVSTHTKDRLKSKGYL